MEYIILIPLYTQISGRTKVGHNLSLQTIPYVWMQSSRSGYTIICEIQTFRLIQVTHRCQIILSYQDIRVPQWWQFVLVRHFHLSLLIQKNTTKRPLPCSNSMQTTQYKFGFKNYENQTRQNRGGAVIRVMGEVLQFTNQHSLQAYPTNQHSTYNLTKSVTLNASKFASIYTLCGIL